MHNPAIFRRGQPIVMLLVLGVGTAFAQELPKASPESLGLSAERLQRIETAVAASIANKEIAGAVTMVVRHGKVA
jgi:hypothetical protein